MFQGYLAMPIWLYGVPGNGNLYKAQWNLRTTAAWLMVSYSVWQCHILGGWQVDCVNTAFLLGEWLQSMNTLTGYIHKTSWKTRYVTRNGCTTRLVTCNWQGNLGVTHNCWRADSKSMSLSHTTLPVTRWHGVIHHSVLTLKPVWPLPRAYQFKNNKTEIAWALAYCMLLGACVGLVVLRTQRMRPLMSQKLG